MWKQIEDYNYSINEYGIVRNDATDRIKEHYKNNNNGYLYVDLWKNNKSHKFPIHRLIAIYFIPNPDNKPTVDHINGNRTDNRIENLRWATYSEQNSRFNTNGVRSEEILAINENGEIIKFDQITKASEYFNCNVSNISQMHKKGTFGKRGKTRYWKFVYLKKV